MQHLNDWVVVDEDDPDDEPVPDDEPEPDEDDEDVDVPVVESSEQAASSTKSTNASFFMP